MQIGRTCHYLQRVEMRAKSPGAFSSQQRIWEFENQSRSA
jgi:hypothetical protein